MEVTLFGHFYNEGLLLRPWVRHHARLFPKAILFDYASTDDSVAVIKELAPKGWEVRQSVNNSFDAFACDVEIIEAEKEVRGWKLALNTTELLLHHDISGFLDEWSLAHPEMDAVAMTSAVICQGIDEPTDLELGRDFFLQRNWGWIDKGCAARPWRYLHRGVHGQYAQVGRHSTGLPHEHDPSLILQWWGWSPWPQVKQRKLQIQDRIPLSNRLVGWGHQHIVTEEQLEERYQETLRWSSDLMLDPHYRATIEKIREVHDL